MIKRTLLAIALIFIASAWTYSQEYLPSWHEGILDIHTIATGRGDATFIVMPDGTTMLIDAGDNGKKKDKQHPDSLKRAGEWIVRYIEHFAPAASGPMPVDYALITHFHDDHMGSTWQMLKGEHGYGLSGMTLVGDRIPIRTLVDRGWPDYSFPSREKVVNGMAKGMFKEYQAFLSYQRAQGMNVEKFQVGSRKQFQMQKDPKPYRKSFEIRNLASNGEVWTGKGVRSSKMYSGNTLLFDENMNSCAIRLRYGDFSYYNGGDLSGGNWPLFKSQERDFETPVAKVCGKVTAMKADHHGYYDTCNGFFMQTLCPQVIVIDARSTNHPVPSTMTRISDPLVWTGERSYYITVDQSKKVLGEELWSKFKPWGHIVIRVYEGGKSYQVFVLDADSLDYRVKYKTEVVSLQK